MPQNATIREASEEDVFAIQQVARTTWHATYDEIIGPSTVDEQVEKRYRDDVIADAVESEDVVYLVASDEDVIGYTSAGPSEQVDDDNTAQLYTIYIDPSYWGKGIGSRLLDAVIERLREDDYGVLRMCVLEANDLGRSFYESYGFPTTEQGTRKIAGEEIDEVIYTGTL